MNQPGLLYVLCALPARNDKIIDRSVATYAWYKKIPSCIYRYRHHQLTIPITVLSQGLPASQYTYMNTSTGMVVYGYCSLPYLLAGCWPALELLEHRHLKQPPEEVCTLGSLYA